MALDMIVDIFKSPWFYGILLALVLLGNSFTRKIFRRAGISKGMSIFIVLVGLGLSMGGAVWLDSGISTASLTGSGVHIAQLQTVTAYVISNDSTSAVVTDSGVDDTRMSNFYATEGDLNSDGTIDQGTWLVTRNNVEKADTCEVRVIKPPRYDISDTTYHIVNEDTNTGVMTAYVYASASTGTANGDEPKESNWIPFAEGVAIGYVGVNISIDETGFDPLTQYDYKDINVMVCDYPYTFRLHKNDA